MNNAKGRNVARYSRITITEPKPALDIIVARTKLKLRG